MSTLFYALSRERRVPTRGVSRSGNVSGDRSQGGGHGLLGSAALREGKGTCSTKHALLAALAEEQNVPVVLTLGIYAMHDRNTPGVGTVLARYDLPSLPEAHCYLTHEGRRIDVTRSGADPTEPITELLYEEAIVPEQIREYKLILHRRFMQNWVTSHAEEVRGRSFEDMWRIREECIAALAQ